VSALNSLARAVGLSSAPSQEDIERLAFRMRETAYCLRRHLGGLATKPVTVKQLLTEEWAHGIDFAFHDKLLADGEAVLEADPDAHFIEHGHRCGFATALDELRAAMNDAEPYRAARVRA
jgi:hypothetical protein